MSGGTRAPSRRPRLLQADSRRNLLWGSSSTGHCLVGSQVQSHHAAPEACSLLLTLKHLCCCSACFHNLAAACPGSPCTGTFTPTHPCPRTGGMHRLPTRLHLPNTLQAPIVPKRCRDLLLMHKDLYMLAHPSLHLDSCTTPSCHCCRAGSPPHEDLRMLREPQAALRL